jgi:hypothetical protein
LSWGRKVDRCEESLRVQVVLARFIAHPNQTVTDGIRVGYDAVHVSNLERCRIAAILHAEGEVGKPGCGHSGRSLLSFIFFLPIPCASYQCSSADRTIPSGSRTVAKPFRFLQRASP